MIRVLAPFALTTVLLLPACQSNKPMSDDGMMMAANQTCPLSGEPIDMSHTVMFEGKTVAFCCPKCQAKWEAMSDEEKEAALSKSMMDH